MALRRDPWWRRCRGVCLVALWVVLAACTGPTPSDPPFQSTADSSSSSPTAIDAPAASPTAPPGSDAGGLVARLPDLTVAAEAPRAGYDRDQFAHWTDADSDCQDTRAEVLAAESHTPVSGCTVTTGEWTSYYDGEVWTDASEVDVDHMVPLAEAWDSGAHRWSTDTRRRFANDLDDDRALVAVTDNVNQSKADQDPAEWLPDRHQCRYIREWVAVKTRWSLTVDPAERDALHDTAQACPDRPVEVELADIDTGSPATPGELADCVDVNRATDAELQRVTHIGAERVDDLIANRPYDTLGQLERIDGIGPARVDDIRQQGLAATNC